MSQTVQPEAPKAAGASPPLRWPARQFVLAVATALGLYLCFLMSIPLLPALAWAAALAVLAWPIYRWIAARVRKPGLAAALSVLAVTVILVVPSAFVAVKLGQEAQATVERLRAMNEESSLWTRLKESPRLAPLIAWVAKHVDLAAESGRLTQALTGGAAGVARGSFDVAVQALVMLFALFYFFRDRDSFLAELHALTPLSQSETERLRKRVRDTVAATLYGRLLVAALQGALGGLMFWWLGLPAPLLWGVIMAFLAIIPMLGSFIVWVPAAIYLAATDHWGKAVILTTWGTLVVGLVDHLLYPILVGDKLRLHPLVVFVSLIGGLVVFGTAGVVLGPVTVSLTDALLELWRRPPEKHLERTGSLLIPT